MFPLLDATVTAKNMKITQKSSSFALQIMNCTWDIVHASNADTGISLICFIFGSINVLSNGEKTKGGNVFCVCEWSARRDGGA